MEHRRFGSSDRYSPCECCVYCTILPFIRRTRKRLGSKCIKASSVCIGSTVDAFKAVWCYPISVHFNTAPTHFSSTSLHFNTTPTHFSTSLPAIIPVYIYFPLSISVNSFKASIRIYNTIPNNNSSTNLPSITSSYVT